MAHNGAATKSLTRLRLGVLRKKIGRAGRPADFDVSARILSQKRYFAAALGSSTGLSASVCR
jgi:hypothetical protein